MASSIVVLLPICAEIVSDDPADHVFQMILKNTLARKSDDNYLSNAFKAGMSGDKVVVGSEILSESWKDLRSPTHRKLQSKLLGYWAIKNYPLMGKKIFGDGWDAPQRKSVEVDRDSKKIECNEIDTFVFQKMKLTLVELTVSWSTLEKLKHFVRAPPTIVKHNPVMISQKSKMFDIHRGYVDTCWNALMNGEFTLNVPSTSLCTPECSVVVNRIIEQPMDLSKNSMLILPKTPDDSESGNLSAKRSRLNSDLHGVLSNDFFEMVVEIRDNVRSIAGRSGEQERGEMELDKTRTELAAKNGMLEETRLEAVKNVEAKEKELKGVRDELATINIKLSESEKMRSETVQMLEATDAELKEARNELAEVVTTKGTELSKVKEELAQQRDQRNAWANYATSKENELASAEEKLAAGRIELENWTIYAKKKESELKEAKHGFEESKTNYRKLEEEFQLYKVNVEGMIPELRRRISEMEGGGPTPENNGDAKEAEAKQSINRTRRSHARPRK